ncbi:MAG: GntR family transcriptional regulator [Novosphingobium sp.]|nr:GntR family transcriptional regulator [Novosphingobium sp.]
MNKGMKPGQHVIVSLRRMIASGELQDGERIAEIPTAEALGVSRMPVRTALRALEQEGLVAKLGSRGYAVRGPSAVEVEAAVEVRGVLEGLAARRLALRGLSQREERAFEQCLASGDALFAKGYLSDEDLEGFHAYNLAFHEQLVRASGNGAIEVALARNNLLPFASAAALALDWEDDREAEFEHLRKAHVQHRAVLAAILAGDADLAETIMRSHAHAATGSARVFEGLGLGTATIAPAKESR